MHEMPYHQASGLRAVARSHNARLVTMISHGDKKWELALLRRLCQSWVMLGYPVTVLDADTAESDNNPGLAQMLDRTFPHHGYGYELSAWTMLPAANGIYELSQSGRTGNPGIRLGELFADDGVVLVYGNAAQLEGLLIDEPCQPLMALSSEPESLLNTYMTIKRLLTTGQFSPLVVEPAQIGTLPAVQTSSALVDCVQNFLGHRLKCIQLRYPQDDMAPASDLQRLALRVLENALPLSDRWTRMQHSGTKMDNRPLSRNH